MAKAGNKKPFRYLYAITLLTSHGRPLEGASCPLQRTMGRRKSDCFFLYTTPHAHTHTCTHRDTAFLISATRIWFISSLPREAGRVFSAGMRQKEKNLHAALTVRHIVLWRHLCVLSLSCRCDLYAKDDSPQTITRQVMNLGNLVSLKKYLSLLLYNNRWLSYGRKGILFVE